MHAEALLLLHKQVPVLTDCATGEEGIDLRAGDCLAMPAPKSGGSSWCCHCWKIEIEKSFLSGDDVLTHKNVLGSADCFVVLAKWEEFTRHYSTSAAQFTIFVRCLAELSPHPCTVFRLPALHSLTTACLGLCSCALT